MKTLRIAYARERLSARMSADVSDLTWQEVRRACLEHCEEVVEIDSLTVELPWVALLNLRQTLMYYLQRHDVRIDLDGDAQRLLEQARGRDKEYELIQQRTLPLMHGEDVLRVLNERGFVRELTKPQMRNVTQLLRLGSGADFSVPGAGKTTEALAYFICKRIRNEKLLVVCPVNAFGVWEEQIEECIGAGNLDVIRLRGGYKKVKELLTTGGDVFLISYQLLPNVQSLVATLLTENDVIMFLDESHKMKRGEGGIIGRSILEVSHLPKAKLILSGTPLPNAIADLVPQFRFLFPEIQSDKEGVVEQIRPIYIRTRKSELNLPPVERKLLSVPMASSQRHLYDLVTSEVLRRAEEQIRAPMRMRLRAIGRSALRLLQLVSNPSLLIDSEWTDHPVFSAVLEEGDSPKLRYVCLRARQLAREGQKVIIWSSFVGNVELIAMRLLDLGADYIHGGVESGSDEEEETREAKVKRFHEAKDAYVLVANPAACGESISLHEVCHHAIYLDRGYNAAHYLQSEDRIHRLGLSFNQRTMVEIVSTPDSVDESVNRRLIRKIDAMGKVLDDTELNVEPVQMELEDVGIDWSELGIDSNDAEDLLEHLRNTVTAE